jgi:hypothetical protein
VKLRLLFILTAVNVQAITIGHGSAIGSAANSASSVFKIESVLPFAGSYAVTWRCVSGKTYRVQATSDLTAAFAELSEGINSIGSLTDYRDLTTDGQRSCRVKLISP